MNPIGPMNHLIPSVFTSPLCIDLPDMPTTCQNMTSFFYKGERYLLPTEHRDPPSREADLANSDVPTRAQLDHPHWALGFPIGQCGVFYA